MSRFSDIRANRLVTFDAGFFWQRIRCIVASIKMMNEMTTQLWYLISANRPNLIPKATAGPVTRKYQSIRFKMKLVRIRVALTKSSYACKFSITFKIPFIGRKENFFLRIVAFLPIFLKFCTLLGQISDTFHVFFQIREKTALLLESQQNNFALQMNVEFVFNFFLYVFA